MEYDIFTICEEIACEIEDRVKENYSTDTTAEPQIYQFFDVSEGKLRKIKRLIFENQDFLEIRESRSGNFIWPSRSGIGIDTALDLL